MWPPEHWSWNWTIEEHKEDWLKYSWILSPLHAESPGMVTVLGHALNDQERSLSKCHLTRRLVQPCCRNESLKASVSVLQMSGRNTVFLTHPNSTSSDLSLSLLSLGFLLSMLLVAGDTPVPCCPYFGWVEVMKKVYSYWTTGLSFLMTLRKAHFLLYNRKGNLWFSFFASSLSFCFVPIFS